MISGRCYVLVETTSSRHSEQPKVFIFTPSSSHPQGHFSNYSIWVGDIAPLDWLPCSESQSQLKSTKPISMGFIYVGPKMTYWQGSGRG